jgi:hypothetical protein
LAKKPNKSTDFEELAFYEEETTDARVSVTALPPAQKQIAPKNLQELDRGAEQVLEPERALMEAWYPVQLAPRDRTPVILWIEDSDAPPVFPVTVGFGTPTT